MIHDFIVQIQHLMEIQNDKKYFKENYSNNYSWISYKRSHVRLNLKEELLIRKFTEKLTARQCCTVLRQLNAWIYTNPAVDSTEIPGICIQLLTSQYNMNVIQTMTNSRARRFQQFIHSTKNLTPNLILTLLHRIQRINNDKLL